MADNVTLNPSPAPFDVATDEIGGVHYQKIKLAYGPSDAATLVDADTGLPVVMNSDFIFRARLGLIPGIIPIDKFGRNSAVSTSATEDIWNGSAIYSGFPLGSPETVTVVSNDNVGGVFRAIRDFQITQSYAVEYATEIPILFEPLDDIVARAEVATANNTTMTASWDGFLVSESLLA